MESFTFSDGNAQKIYEEKCRRLKAIAAEHVDDTAYLWDAAVLKYAVKMEQVKRLVGSDEMKGQVTEKMSRDIDLFLSRCSDAQFHIALVGAIKAGKSTLINAMLGYAYASTKVTPETASLTKFKKGTENYVKVRFYSPQEWDTLWESAKEAKASVFLEEYQKLGAEAERGKWLGKPEIRIPCADREGLVLEIQKWTSSKSVCHYFVKEVEVGLAEFGLPEGVILVDTPGLDDVVEYRSNITRDYIDRANAVLVCVKADALTGPEMATVYSVFSNTRYNPQKVYIIATQTDTLNRPQENWAEQQEEWLKYLKGKGAYASLQLARKNLLPVSAYLYSLLKEYDSIREGEDRYWDMDSIIRKFRVRMEDIGVHYRRLLDFTNIELLKQKIQEEIVANHKKLLVDDITGTYQICRESILEAMQKIKGAQEEVLKAGQGGLEEIRKKQEEYSKKYEEAKKDRQELEGLLERFRQASSQKADELEQAIRNLNCQEVHYG